MPVNVSMREVTNSSVRVLWHQPTHPNGIIQGYRMYFMHQNFTDVRTVRDPKDKMEFLLEGLGESFLHPRKKNLNIRYHLTKKVSRKDIERLSLLTKRKRERETLSQLPFPPYFSTGRGEEREDF